jgi:4-amino-4-deoxy-L-arabinose transferase-like glycosyltransferase
MEGVRQVRTDQRRWVQALAVISVTLLFLLLNLQWMERYRYGGVLDIDEAGYLGYSTAYAKAWVGGGLKAWLNAVNAPGAHAPLLPALTSFLLAASGFSLNVGMLTNTFVACALILVVHALCRMLGGGAFLPFAAGVFLATLPAVVDYSRNYQFAMLAALTYAGTMLAIIKSDGFTKRAWSVWAGVFLACLILSRTMTVAFLPCFGLAALFAIWSRGGLRDKAVWRNVGWAALAFFLVALTWYARHYKSVFEYLFSFGYGANAAEYGKNVEDGYLQFFLARISVESRAKLSH